jgi:hypothetical protein
LGAREDDMSEKITEIRDASHTEVASVEFSRFDGYEVVTTEQTIRLLIDNSQSCCETWGYFWCNDNPQEFVGAEVRGVSVTDTALNTKKLDEKDCNDRDEGGIMFVNIDTDRGVLQFVAYNSHNGYYGHVACVECKQLTCSEGL